MRVSVCSDDDLSKLQIAFEVVGDANWLTLNYVIVDRSGCVGLQFQLKIRAKQKFRNENFVCV